MRSLIRDLPCRSQILDSIFIILSQLDTGAQYDCGFSCAKDKTDKWKSPSSLFSGWMDLNYMTSELLFSAFTIHNSKTEQHAIKLIGDYDIVAAAVCRCLHHPICWGQHLPPPQSKTVSFHWGTDWMLKFIIMPLRCEISFWRANSLSWGQHHQRAQNATKTH